MEIVRVIRSAELPPRHGLFAWRCTVRGTTLEGRSRQPLLEPAAPLNAWAGLPLQRK
jgi:hypothetical protein